MPPGHSSSESSHEAPKNALGVPSSSSPRDDSQGPYQGQLGQIARRAAARAREIADPRSSAQGAAKASNGNGEPRPHVTVRPRTAADTHFAAESEGRGPGGAENADFSPKGASRHREDRDLVGEALVRAAAPGSQLVIPPGSRLTPLARDLAFDKGITFTTGRYAEPSGPAAAGAHRRRRSSRIAIASDHGGFALKDQLIALLKEMGERPMDLGPAAAAPPVDYPDFARLVAAEVSAGRADLGIIVDGAGIGSAMVANKLPGVRAANCWNEASARNAREHNHANVLTLGSGHLDLGGARLVIAAFLSTDLGDDRHARRAKKLDSIEAEYLRTRQITAQFEEGR